MSQPAPDYTDRGPLNRPLCPHGQRYYCSKCPDLPNPPQPRASRIDFESERI